MEEEIMLILSPSGHRNLGWCLMLEPDWLVYQGWSVLGLRELRALASPRASHNGPGVPVALTQPPTFRISGRN